MFLNAAATGDASNLPDPKTCEEMYLEAIAQGGGGGSSALIVEVTETPGPNEGETTYTANKTAGEIINAMPLVFYKNEDHGATAFSRCSSYYYAEGEGYTFVKLDGDHDLFAATINDYPSRTVGGK